jgi:carbonic anhydrase
MVCPPSKIPINIKSKSEYPDTNITNLLQLDYEDSVCRIKNMCSHLLIPYEDSQKTPVVFDNKYYRLKNIKIYRPSLHKFDGIETEGEIMLNHKGEKETLKICIPLVKTDEEKNENNTLKQIFRHSFSKVQCNGESVMIHNIILNAKSFIPKTKGFYYYESTTPIDEPCVCRNNICGETTHVVVYHKDDGYVGISSENKVILNKLLTKHVHGINDASYKYNAVHEKYQEGFDLKKHNENAKRIIDFAHMHDKNDVKGDKPIKNTLFDAVYKGDVDEVMNVLGGKKKVKRRMSEIRNYKWIKKHVIDYMYYMIGFITIVLYYIVTASMSSNEEMSDLARQANSALQDTFGRAAAKTGSAPTLAGLANRLDVVETKINV